MPITNYVPSSLLSKPGVCTSTTRPAVPYNGQVIYQTDTNTTLVWNGSGWVLLSTGTANPVGLEFITKKSWTSGGTLSVDGCFTSAYSSYRLVIRNAKHATTDVNILFRLRANGSDNAGPTGYYWALKTTTFAGADNSSALANTDSIRTIGATLTLASGGVIEVIDPQKTNATLVNTVGQITATNGEIRFGAGMLNNTTSYDGFTLVANSGNFASLDVYVYGYRES